MATITISGTGSASAPCQSVAISIRVARQNKSSRKAREEAKRVLEDVYGKVRNLAGQGIRFDAAGMEASFAIDVVHDSRGTTPTTQYAARYSLRLVSEDQGRFTEIFDAMTDLEGVTADSPVFGVDARTEQRLRNEAFRGAVEQAKARFAFQCGVIGLEAGAFHVTSWSYSRHEMAPYQGKRLVVESDQTSVEGGAVSAKITVNLTYERTTASS